MTVLAFLGYVAVVLWAMVQKTLKRSRNIAHFTRLSSTHVIVVHQHGLFRDEELQPLIMTSSLPSFLSCSVILVVSTDEDCLPGP